MVKSGNWNFEVLLDGDKNLRKALGVRMVPLTLVIKNNKIVYREAGYSKDSKQKLYNAIKKTILYKRVCFIITFSRFNKNNKATFKSGFVVFML